MTGDGLGAPPCSRNEWEDEHRTLTEANRTLRSELERQAKRIKELEEALAPFAVAGRRNLVPFGHKVEAFRRAAKALETKEGNDGKTK